MAKKKRRSSGQERAQAEARHMARRRDRKRRVIAVVAAIWSTPGPAVLLKLVVLGVTAGFLLVLTGAVSPGELRAAVASLLAMPAGEDKRE